MNVYEQFGRVTEALNITNNQLQSCMKLLAAIKAGEIHIDRVTINKDGWTVAPESTDDPDGGEALPDVAGKVG